MTQDHNQEVTQINKDERKQIQINDIKLAYYEKGRGDILLLLHGNSLDSCIFKYLFNHFSKKYKVIAIDSRGHGLSDSGEIPYNINLFVEDVISFCSKKEIKSVNIIGYSDGGNIALVLSKICPKLVNKMIIISGNYKVDGIKRWGRIAIKLLLLVLTPFIKYSKSAKIQKWKLELMLMNTGLSKEDFQKVNQPTLILAAERDLIYELHTKEIHHFINNSILTIIKESNHFNIINKNETLQAIERFIG